MATFRYQRNNRHNLWKDLICDNCFSFPDSIKARFVDPWDQVFSYLILPGQQLLVSISFYPDYFYKKYVFWSWYFIYQNMRWHNMLLVSLIRVSLSNRVILKVYELFLIVKVIYIHRANKVEKGKKKNLSCHQPKWSLVIDCVFIKLYAVLYTYFQLTYHKILSWYKWSSKSYFNAT